MMEAFRVAPTAMVERLDPGHYRPVLVENDALLRRFGARDLGELYLRSGIGHTAAVTPHYTSTEDGVAFVSGGCIVDGHLDMDGAARIQRSAHAGIMSGSRLEPGWVLFVRKGELGNSAIVPPGTEVNCSSEVMFLEMRPDEDSGFVSSYFNSRHGRMAFLRQQRGMMITSISLYDVPALPVPKVQRDAARYIGDKIRQAERLRARARSMRRQLGDLLSLPELHEALRTEDRRANRVAASDLNTRLDAKYYGPHAMAVLQATGANSVEIGKLVQEVSNGFEHREFEVDGTPYITVTEVSGGRLALATAPRLGSGVSIPEKARIDTCCALVVRTGSIGVAVPVFDDDTYAAISSHLIRLRFTSKQEAAVVAAFLNSEAGRILLRKISYGAVQPQIGQDELLSLPLPRVLLDRSESILQALKTEDRAVRAAERLTSAAKSIVEQLIEGRITEADLVAAQKALEAGDRSADRAILRALWQGEALRAKPLIPDLDELYALLDEPDGETNG